ncbi:MAG: hypothetical protein AAB438_01530 [Patescibacteria group bacterium]
MHKISSLQILVLLIGIFFIFNPQSSLAAQLSFKIVPNTEYGDKATNIEVRVDPESKNINVIEGGISFSGPSSKDLFIEIIKDNSVFSIWPTEPFFDKDKKIIYFVAGTPQGLNQEGLLFKIRLFSEIQGKLDVSWSGVKTFLNDGLGTEEATSVKSLTLELDNQDLEKINNKSVESFEQKEIFSRFNFSKSVIILLLIIILVSTIFYGYKKFIKN